jgi:hypothetical protein
MGGLHPKSIGPLNFGFGIADFGIFAFQSTFRDSTGGSSKVLTLERVFAMIR